MKPLGIAELGVSRFGHTFGGQSWAVVCPQGSAPPAVLIAVLDGDDPLVPSCGLSSVPLCTRVDYDTPKRQSYKVKTADRVALVNSPVWTVIQDPSDLLPWPIEEKKFVLRQPRANEDVSTAASEYEVQDTFLGGEGFFRVGGEPLWLQDEEESGCECGAETIFVASVGYENYDNPAGFVTSRIAFFIGELALYFFTCPECSTILVISQSS